jgi:beta-mannosidase
MVEMLGHHPSIAIWCGHNEPMAIENTDIPTQRSRLVRLAARMAAHQLLPTWNKTVLDASVARTIGRADGTRPVIPHSGVWPHLPQIDGTDTHVYFGWYHGEARDFAAFCRTIPRMARFVTEFGAQAVPATADFMEPERWPDLDWDRLAARHSLQKTRFDRHVPPAAHRTFEEWRDSTQRYQAETIRLHVETLRRLKYRPNGGFCHFALNDCYPSVTWSVVDDAGVPKAGYEALAAACRPVIVVADWPPAVVRPGEALALDVHVVSDRREPLDGAQCSARAVWSGGSEEWEWVGDVPADSCVRVGTMQLVVPPAPGELTLELTLHAGADVVGNRYLSQISPARGS